MVLEVSLKHIEVLLKYAVVNSDDSMRVRREVGLGKKKNGYGVFEPFYLKPNLILKTY